MREGKSRKLGCVSLWALAPKSKNKKKKNGFIGGGRDGENKRVVT